MSLEIKVNDENFNLFKQVDISRSLDDFSGEARFITSEPVNDRSFVKINDEIQILLDGIPVITGYVDTISDSESDTGHDISYTVRDKVQDIIDSTVPDNVKTVKNTKKFSKLCELIINGLGMDIDVIDDVGAEFGEKLKAAEVGQNAAEFLQEYARKVQVFLNTDGGGNILIRRPEGTLKTYLLSVVNGNNNNIISSNIELNYKKRYNKYTVRSNANATEDGDTEELNQVGVAFDDEIRAERIFEKVSESPMTAQECAKAAEEEANIRRLKSFSYTCTVAGYSANEELWQIGKLVNVQDEKKGVIGKFAIRGITYKYSESGELTTIDLTYSDAYQVEANLSASKKRESEMASTYTIQSGDTLSDIAQKNNLTVSELLSINPQITNPDAIQEGQVINLG